jgi:hypothetical protein
MASFSCPNNPMTWHHGAASPSRADLAGNAAGESGFALVLTLIVILALSLLTEMMTRWVSIALVHATAQRDEVAAKAEMADAEAVALYVLATRPVSQRGVELLTIKQLRAPPAAVGPVMLAQRAESYLHLDDRPYRLGNVTLRFQDARGLVNLNWTSEADLHLLLASLGVPVADRGPLIAKLQDYIDADSFIRLNGAEAKEYEAVGRDPPANAPMRTPWEVRRILDWDKIEGIAADDTKWPLLTTTAPIAGVNLNTTPPELLALIPGMTPDLVAKVLRWRNETPLSTALDLRLLTGLPIADDPLRDIYFPASSLILTISSERWPLERRIAVRKTSKSRTQPWIIDYSVDTPPLRREGEQPRVDDFPDVALLSSAP